MIPKSGAKFEEKLIFCFKNDKNLVNFNRSTKKSKKFAFWLVPFVNSIQRYLKKYRRVIFHDTEESEKSLENHRNLANFHQNTRKCQNWYFHGILSFKVETAWATNLQTSYKQWHWRMIKIWRRIDLSFQNWHKEFDGFWLENSKVSKIYTLMSCFWPKYIMFEIKKYRGAIFHDTRVWCKI